MLSAKRFCQILAITVTTCLFCVTIADAKKPEKPPGGGGGDIGSGGYARVLLSDEQGNTGIAGTANELREVVSNGALSGVEVVGALSGKAYYWLLDSAGNVIMATPLPAPPAPDLSAAMDLNAAGVVVGSRGVLADVRPVYWPSLSSAPVDLPVPAGLTGNAVNINENGMIVGELDDPINETELAAVWQLTGDPANPVAGPLLLTEATTVWVPAINDAGTVVVTSAFQGLRWEVNWDGTSLTASAAEELTGSIPDENGVPRAVILHSTGLNELGDLCGEYTAIGGGMWGTFLLLSDGTLIDLPTPDSKRYVPLNNDAYDLTDDVDATAIQIVGSVSLFDKRTSINTDDMPVLWQGGTVTDLETVTSQPNPKLRLSGIDRVSNQGWLSGHAEDPDTSLRYGVVLVPQ